MLSIMLVFKTTYDWVLHHMMFNAFEFLLSGLLAIYNKQVSESIGTARAGSPYVTSQSPA